MEKQTLESLVSELAQALEAGDFRLAFGLAERVRAAVDALVGKRADSGSAALLGGALERLENARRSALAQRAHLQHALAHLPPPNPYREPRAQQGNWRLSG